MGDARRGSGTVLEPVDGDEELSTRERQRRDTRERIFAAAAAEIDRDGLAGLSYVRVARAAGVARQTVYDHFPTPDAIVDEAFRRFRAGLAERLDPDQLAAAPLDEVLHAFVDGVFGTMGGQGERMRLEISAYLTRGVEVGTWLDEPLFRLVADAAEREPSTASGSTRRDPGAVARLALTALSGFVLMETESPERRAERAHDAVALLVAGLRSDGGPR